MSVSRKIIRNSIIVVIFVIIITLLAFFAYNLFNNSREGLTNGDKPYDVDKATKLATDAIATANAENPLACNSIKGSKTNKNVQSGLNALDATGITNPIQATFNDQCDWEWIDGSQNKGTVTTETIEMRKIKAQQLAIEGVKNIIDSSACSSATNKNFKGALGSLNINKCDPTSAIYNNKCTWDWACDRDIQYSTNDIKTNDSNPPSVIAKTNDTPSGYQNTRQFDSVPGLTSGDNSAREISLYFGNLLQNLLTVVKHDQTHKALANAFNILTNSGNRASSTNLVSSKSALNPQAGYPNMNYHDSSITPTGKKNETNFLTVM